MKQARARDGTITRVKEIGGENTAHHKKKDVASEEISLDKAGDLGFY